MPNITVTIDQTIHDDARVRAVRMAAFSGRPNVRQSTQNKEKVFKNRETVKAG